jgi:hypothetical protein
LDLLNPSPKDIALEDVAWGLANKCRFTGQCDRYYSVAEHCVIGSQVIAAEHALAFLLHEADEVYLPDLASPLKALVSVDGHPWKVLARRHEAAVLSALGLPGLAVHHPEVKLVDTALLAREASLVWSGGARTDWTALPDTLPEWVQPAFFTPEEAARSWLNTFNYWKTRLRALYQPKPRRARLLLLCPGASTTSPLPSLRWLVCHALPTSNTTLASPCIGPAVSRRTTLTASCDT